MSEPMVDWAAALAEIEAEIAKLQAAADVIRERIGRSGGEPRPGGPSGGGLRPDAFLLVDEDASEVSEELLAVQTANRLRKPFVINAHRQGPPQSTRGDSWWTKTSRENHAATANQELGRMSRSKEGRLTAARIIE